MNALQGLSSQNELKGHYSISEIFKFASLLIEYTSDII